VRLKGGDPFVFGRGGEEALALAQAGIPFEVVPGVSSAVAVPAYAGIPLTHRGIASSFAVVTGHEDTDKLRSSVDWARLARAADTLVVLMGLKSLPRIARTLVANGRPVSTPVALVRWGTTDVQETVTSPSSHRRGHGSVLFYTEALLAYWEARGVPVINPVAAFRFEKSKALQAGLFERVGVRYPRTIVVNHRDQVLKASGELRFPILVKPNVGGSGALIERFDSRADLEARVTELDFGPDGTALVQEYVESADGAIVRVE